MLALCSDSLATLARVIHGRDTGRPGNLKQALELGGGGVGCGRGAGKMRSRCRHN